jgi:hypothetical protein
MENGLKKEYQRLLNQSFKFSFECIKVLDDIGLDRDDYGALYKSLRTFNDRIYDKNNLDNFQTEYEEDGILTQKSRYSSYLNGASPIDEISSVKKIMKNKIVTYVKGTKSYHKNLLISIYGSFSIGDYVGIKILESGVEDTYEAVNTWIKIKGNSRNIKNNLLEKVINYCSGKS